jgi:death-on-curing protein
MPYRFLTKAEVLCIHNEMIRRYGGRPRIWDENALDAAVQAPRAGFAGVLVHDSLSKVAAAYWFHISQAHAFEAANKRTAVEACLVFLRLNGHTIVCDHSRLAEVAIQVATGEMTEAALADWLDEHIEPLL